MANAARVAGISLALAFGLAASAPCQAAPDVHWSRNPHGFELGVEQDAANQDSSWTGWMTVRACAKPSCFQTRAPVTVKVNAQYVWETTVPLPGGACRLKVVNVSYHDMDSDDWKVTAAPASPGGCAEAPAGITGLYRSERP